MKGPSNQNGILCWAEFFGTDRFQIEIGLDYYVWNLFRHDSFSIRQVPHLSEL